MGKQSMQTAPCITTGTPEWKKKLERVQKIRKRVRERQQIARTLAATIEKGCLTMKEFAASVSKVNKVMKSFTLSFYQMRARDLRYINDNWVQGKKLQEQFLTKGHALKYYSL